LAPAKQAIRRTSLRYCLTDWGGKKEPAITFLFHQNIKKSRKRESRVNLGTNLRKREKGPVSKVTSTNSNTWFLTD